MRYQSFFTSILVLVAAVVNAQMNPAIPSQACNDCINSNIRSLSPCSTIEYSGNYAVPSTLDAESKKCACVQASTTSWITSCQGESKCSSSFVQTILQSYEVVKPKICEGVDINSLNNPSNTAHLSTTPFNIARATALGVTVVAIGQVL
ncbi:hypothetical protein BX616_006322 [Lobosporangium transversale]|nr:hypothetical protein BX616_006322 [Lobosporangium transversale]